MTNNFHYNLNALGIPEKLSNFSINIKCNLDVTYSYEKQSDIIIGFFAWIIFMQHSITMQKL